MKWRSLPRPWDPWAHGRCHCRALAAWQEAVKALVLKFAEKSMEKIMGNHRRIIADGTRTVTIDDWYWFICYMTCTNTFYMYWFNNSCSINDLDVSTVFHLDLDGYYWQYSKTSGPLRSPKAEFDPYPYVRAQLEAKWDLSNLDSCNVSRINHMFDPQKVRMFHVHSEGPQGTRQGERHVRGTWMG